MSLPPVPPSGSTTSSVDAERDAWLSEALRHAPDADVAPPAALSDMILREAQTKAKPSAPLAKPRPSFWTRVWVWTAQPAVGAGLASVMVASLVGAMFWDRPPEENTPRSLPEVAVTPAPVATPVQKEAPAAPMAEQAKQAPPSTVASDTAATADNMARGLAQGQPEKSRRDASADARQLAESRRRREAPAAYVPNPPAESSLKQKDENKPADSVAHPDAFAKAARTAEAMSPAAPAVKAMPAPIPAPAPTVATPAPAAPAATTIPPLQIAEPAPAAPAPMAAQKRDSNAARATMQDRLAPAVAGGRSAASAESEFDKLRAGLAAEPATWVWQHDGGQPHVVDDDLSAFLAEVDAVAASRWQRPGAKLLASGASEPSSLRSERANTPANQSVPPQTVRLMRNGKVTHTLRLDADSLRWEHDTPDTRVVTELVLDEAQTRRIRRALDKLGP